MANGFTMLLLFVVVVFGRSESTIILHKRCPYKVLTRRCAVGNQVLTPPPQLRKKTDRGKYFDLVCSRAPIPVFFFLFKLFDCVYSFKRPPSVTTDCIDIESLHLYIIDVRGRRWPFEAVNTTRTT